MAGAGGSRAHVTLPSTWYAGASLLGATTVPVALAAAGETVVATLPALPGGGVLVARRPAEAVENIGVVEVTAEKLPEVGEILARHHRAAARQERAFATWRARQRLLVRVWIAELTRSFEAAPRRSRLRAWSRHRSVGRS
jgi:hypothetical protein